MISDIYQIVSREESDQKHIFKISLNRDHIIYQSHFPGNPITPGVIIIEILNDLLNIITDRKLSLVRAKNIKYLKTISPEEHPIVYFSINVQESDSIFTAACDVWYGETLFTRISSQYQQRDICIIIPTYNNSSTLKSVVESALQSPYNVIVVNDGSTDDSQEIILSFGQQIDIISYTPNRGKGHALKEGFRYAGERGYRYAITMDSDGQHKASDIALFAERIKEYPDSLIIGARNLDKDVMRRGSSFANSFSNFWYTVQTGIRLKDTQSGYRLYPLEEISGIKIFSNRYEAELEIIIKAAWRGIRIENIPVDVYYPPKSERVSHFRPFTDFCRITLLNTIFVFGALFWGYPSMLIRRYCKK